MAWNRWLGRYMVIGGEPVQTASHVVVLFGLILTVIPTWNVESIDLVVGRVLGI